MGWTQTPLDTITVLVAGTALGLVVDDTIHILQGFRRECAATGNVEEATARTMQARGRAMLFTTVVLISAFSSYDFTSADTVSNLGWLTALAVLLTFLIRHLLVTSAASSGLSKTIGGHPPCSRKVRTCSTRSRPCRAS